MPAKCPKCATRVASLNIIPVKASDGGETEHEALVLSCPNCDAVLGAEINPLKVKERLLQELETQLR